MWEFKDEAKTEENARCQTKLDISHSAVGAHKEDFYLLCDSFRLSQIRLKFDSDHVTYEELCDLASFLYTCALAQDVTEA